MDDRETVGYFYGQKNHLALARMTMHMSPPPQKPRAGDHTRRHRRASTSQRPTDLNANPAGTKVFQASSPQGEVWIRLQRHQTGLYVEREEVRPRNRRCLQSMHFCSTGDFERWCDDDPIRFQHPRMHIELKRDAAVLLQSRD